MRYRRNEQRFLLRATSTVGALASAVTACVSPAIGSIGVPADGGTETTTRSTTARSTAGTSSTMCVLSGSYALGPDGCPTYWPSNCPVTVDFPQCTGTSSRSSTSTMSTPPGLIVMPPDGGDGG